jgi:hypothetical protein
MLPTEPKDRKNIPLASGALDYFPSALVAVAALSAKGNDQHNPGQSLHWDRSKSGDEADALLRHLIQRGTVDTDGILHSTKVAWRALALLQKELEASGAPIARGARNVSKARPFPDASDLPESPVLAALIELQDEDGPISGLKAGEAHEHNPAAYAAATARLTDEE